MSGFSDQVSEAIPYLKEFCQKYDVRLTGIYPNLETGTLEPMYFFSSETGGFTLEGVLSSLQKIPEEIETLAANPELRVKMIQDSIRDIRKRLQHKIIKFY